MTNYPNDIPTPKQVVARARALQDRSARLREGAGLVEGIRQVLAAIEAGHELEMLLIDPAKLRSDVARQAVLDAEEDGIPVVDLPTPTFARISQRDNPVGIAAIVRWRPLDLDAVHLPADGLAVLCDDLRDPGNVGTIARTLDAAGGDLLILHGGVDAMHPTALRASLGSLFHIQVAQAPSLDAAFAWAAAQRVQTVATSAHAEHAIWDTELQIPGLLLIGNEARGLDEATRERCDLQVSIPMQGRVTSLNASVAAGALMLEYARQRHARR